MLYQRHVKCADETEFVSEIEGAVALCIETDSPIRVMGHRGPLDENNEGEGGIMFCMMAEPREIIYSVRYQTFNNRDVFEYSYDIKHRLRLAGKLIGYAEWEEDIVSHIATIDGWDYGIIATDEEAIRLLLTLDVTDIKRGGMAAQPTNGIPIR